MKKGSKLSKKHKNNIRLSKLGKKRKSFSEEWKENIRRGCIGINKGKSNGNFIDGRTSKIYYCKEIKCNKEISYRAWKYGQGMCIYCAHKGFKHNKKTKDKIKKANSGKNNHNYKNGIKNKKVYCIDCDKRLKNNYAKRCGSCAGKKRFQNIKELVRARKRVLGKNNPMFGKLPKHGIYGKFKGIKMRSSWEIKFAQFLSLSGIKYKYESKTFDLKTTTYTPDFYIKKWDLYIEIKGMWIHDAKQKFNKFKRLYPNINIKVFNESKLLKYGVII